MHSTELAREKSDRRLEAEKRAHEAEQQVEALEDKLELVRVKQEAAELRAQVSKLTPKQGAGKAFVGEVNQADPMHSTELAREKSDRRLEAEKRAHEAEQKTADLAERARGKSEAETRASEAEQRAEALTLQLAAALKQPQQQGEGVDSTFAVDDLTVVDTTRRHSRERNLADVLDIGKVTGKLAVVQKGGQKAGAASARTPPLRHAQKGVAHRAQRDSGASYYQSQRDSMFNNESDASSWEAPAAPASAILHHGEQPLKNPLRTQVSTKNRIANI
jgi:hypothetical protein